MALWDDLLDEIYVLTNRPDLSAETAIALRQTTRLAHKSGKYWRDLKTKLITGLALDAIQSIDLAVEAPRFRGVARLCSTDNPQLEFKDTLASDLLDPDGYYRTNVYWGLGNRLNVRAAAPEAAYTLDYFEYPIMTPTASYATWLAEEHRDLLVTMSAANVLSMVGETEIAGRLQGLATAELAMLKNSNLEIVGR